MPICKCGKKIDRLQEAVQCNLCNKIFHAVCCNIKIAEIAFIKNAYKCENCLKARRSSLSSSLAGIALPETRISSKEVSSVVSSAPTSSGDSAEIVSVDAFSCEKADVTMQMKMDFVPFSDNAKITADNINNNNSELSSQKSFFESSAQALVGENKSTDTCNESCMKRFESTINLLISEIKALKLSVNSLKEENKQLVTVVRELKSNSTNAPKSSKPLDIAVSSPKRKKVKETNSIVAAVPYRSNINADHIPECSNKKSYAAIAQSSSIGNACNTINNAPNLQNINNIGTSAIKNNSVDDAWNTVKSKKKKTAVNGSNVSDELDVFARFKWVHLSSFKNTVTTESIISYITKQTGIKNSNFTCFKLVKKDIDVTNLKFVNFKLGVTNAYYKKMFDSSIWPANIKVRPFNFLAKENVPNLEQQIQETIS